MDQYNRTVLWMAFLYAAISLALTGLQVGGLVWSLILFSGSAFFLHFFYRAAFLGKMPFDPLT